MERYTILVAVEARSQSDAFAFVERAVERDLDNEAYLDGVDAEKRLHGTVHVSTPDGTKAVAFEGQ